MLPKDPILSFMFGVNLDGAWDMQCCDLYPLPSNPIPLNSPPCGGVLKKKTLSYESAYPQILLPCYNIFFGVNQRTYYKILKVQLTISNLENHS